MFLSDCPGFEFEILVHFSTKIFHFRGNKTINKAKTNKYLPFSIFCIHVKFKFIKFGKQPILVQWCLDLSFFGDDNISGLKWLKIK